MRTISIKSFILLVLLSVTTQVQAKHHKHIKQVHHKTNHKMSGTSSWYSYQAGNRSHKTASGEVFSPNKHTAAHRTLPFGTKVKVTNMKNQKSVIVTINDRGPFIKGRIIDLSKAAAKAIGMDGIQKVNLRIVS